MMPIYMNFGGDVTPEIRGDVADPQHQGWIDLDSLQWVAGKGTSTATGQSSEKPAPKTSDLVITKRVDRASSGLFRYSLQGSGKKVRIDFVKTDGPTPFVYLTIILSDVLISGYSQGGASKSARESLNMSFSSIEWGTGKGVTPHSTAPPDSLTLSPSSIMTQ